MTTLYKPVLIESAEQAEALPDGTLAYLEHSTTAPDPLVPNVSRLFVSRSTASKATTNWWLTSGNARSDADMLGWTALVPIEAEEEWALVLDDEGSMDVAADEAEVREWVLLGDEPRPPVTRLVTPWEESR